jgi:sugar phosphate isomerase/epimerase
MNRPLTVFTGQWADLPIEELAATAGGWGFDGLELACRGDHFNVRQALTDPTYVKRRRALLDAHGLDAALNRTGYQGPCPSNGKTSAWTGRPPLRTPYVSSDR